MSERFRSTRSRSSPEPDGADPWHSARLDVREKASRDPGGGIRREELELEAINSIKTYKDVVMIVRTYQLKHRRRGHIMLQLPKETSCACPSCRVFPLLSACLTQFVFLKSIESGYSG